MTARHPSELRALWRDVAASGFELPTVEFYGHRSGHYRSFSNFYEHASFDFTVPEQCGRAAIVASGRSATVPVTFTEKAIMLCKAAVMDDMASFDAIARAQAPAEAKRLVRGVGPWDQRKWDAAVCTVALEVVSQKFTSVPGLAALLLGTGRRVIAEMTRNDANWGTGLDIGHADANRPPHWRGTNILGWALMAAREHMRASERAAAASASGAAPPQAAQLGEVQHARIGAAVREGDLSAVRATLSTLLGNVVAHPREAKFRTLRTSNGRIAQVLAAPGARALLLAAGFVEQGELLVLPAAVPADGAAAALAALVTQAPTDAAPAADAPEAEPEAASEAADVDVTDAAGGEDAAMSEASSAPGGKAERKGRKDRRAARLQSDWLSPTSDEQ